MAWQYWKERSCWSFNRCPFQTIAKNCLFTLRKRRIRNCEKKYFIPVQVLVLVLVKFYDTALGVEKTIKLISSNLIREKVNGQNKSDLSTTGCHAIPEKGENNNNFGTFNLWKWIINRTWYTRKKIRTNFVKFNLWNELCTVV